MSYREVKRGWGGWELGCAVFVMLIILAGLVALWFGVTWMGFR